MVVIAVAAGTRTGWLCESHALVNGGGRIFRERLSALEAATSEPSSLSLRSLCRSLTRSQAARLFYQVCGVQTLALC